MSKKWHLMETGPSYDQTFACSSNPGQLFETKYRNTEKLNTTRKVWYLLLHAFLTAMAKV